MKNFISKHSTYAAYTTAQSSFDKPHVAFIEELAGLADSVRYIDDIVNLVTAYVGSTPGVTAAVGDILWSDMQVTSTVRPTSDGAIPIGICCIASDAATPGDGKSRFIGLMYLTSNGPSVKATTLNNASTFNPSDLIIPENIISENNFYSGKEQTLYLVEHSDSAPAIDKCVQYTTIGTNAGDWYLGSTQEMKSVFENSIKARLTELQTDYSNYCIASFSTNSYYVTSTVLSANYVNIVTANGYSWPEYRNQQRFVLPMLRVQGPSVKYYSDSNNTTEISTPDADVIYKVSDGTNITYMKWNSSAYEAATFDTKKKYIDGNTKYRWNGTALVVI